MSLVQDDIDHIEQIVRKLITDVTRPPSLRDYDEKGGHVLHRPLRGRSGRRVVFGLAGRPPIA